MRVDPRRLRGSGAATISTSPSPRTRSSATWCERSSARCCRRRRSGSRSSSRAGRGSEAGRHGAAVGAVPRAASSTRAHLTGWARAIRSAGAVSRRPLRSRRHPDRLGPDDHRLDAACIRDRARAENRTRSSSAAAIGGPGLIAQMRDLDPDRVDELVEVYRAHNEPLHATLEAFEGVLELLSELRRRGHQLGIVTAKRLATVQLAFDRFPLLARATDVLVGAEDTERHKPEPDPVLEALRRIDAEPGEAVYVGDSPFDIRAGEGGRSVLDRGRLGRDSSRRATTRRGAGRIRPRTGGDPRRLSEPSQMPLRPSRSCDGSSPTTRTAITCSTIPRSRTPSTTPSTTSCRASSRLTRSS